MAKIGLVIPVLNQFKMAVDLIAHARSSHDLETFIIPQYRNQIPLSSAWNQGAEEAFRKQCDYALIMNDDILLGPWTIDVLTHRMIYGRGNEVLCSGKNARGIMSPDDVLNCSEPNWLQEWDTGLDPDFSCFMISQRTFEEVGKFDPQFTPAYFEDNDYHRRINLAGKKAVSVTAATMYHFGSQTQNSNKSRPIVSGALFEANRSRYKAKWGGVPGEEKWEHPYNDDKYTFKD